MAERICSVEECDRTDRGGNGMCSLHYQRWKKWGDPQKTIRIVGDPVRRFWSYVDRFGPDECWLWMGGSRGGGYGAFWDGTRRVRAYRYAYELLIERIPTGLDLDHLCRNHGCVNPAHLEPVTTKVNILRGVGAPAQNARKTHCKYDHPLEGENLRVRSGRRDCMICVRRRAREVAARRRARRG